MITRYILKFHELYHGGAPLLYLQMKFQLKKHDFFAKNGFRGTAGAPPKPPMYPKNRPPIRPPHFGAPP